MATPAVNCPAVNRGFALIEANPVHQKLSFSRKMSVYVGGQFRLNAHKPHLLDHLWRHLLLTAPQWILVKRWLTDAISVDQNPINVFPKRFRMNKIEWNIFKYLS
jgi:hypothetical protein